MASSNSIAACLFFWIALPAAAHAGMGNRGITPKYHPEPCQGDACRADDARSGLPCEGLLCTFSTAKSMQPPVTAAQAADAQRAAAEPVKPIDAVPVPKLDKAAKKKTAKRATKTKISAEAERPATAEK